MIAGRFDTATESIDDRIFLSEQVNQSRDVVITTNLNLHLLSLS